MIKILDIFFTITCTWNVYKKNWLFVTVLVSLASDVIVNIHFYWNFITPIIILQNVWRQRQFWQFIELKIQNIRHMSRNVTYIGSSLSSMSHNHLFLKKILRLTKINRNFKKILFPQQERYILDTKKIENTYKLYMVIITRHKTSSILQASFCHFSCHHVSNLIS